MNKEIEKIQQEYQELKEDYLNELGENYKLTELWLKSQQENKQLKHKIEKLKDYGEKVGERRNQLYDRIDKAINYIKENDLYSEDYWEEIGHTTANDEVARKDLLEILGGNNE